MQAMDGYQRAALSLQGLSESEQRWFLEQLLPDDRERIDAVLSALNRKSVNAVSVRPNGSGADQTSADDIDVINSWDIATFVAVLSDEPEWVIAAVLASVEGATMEAVLNQLPPLRSAEVRELAQRAAEPLKPRAQQAMLRCVLDKAKRRRLRMTPISGFEAALRRATQDSQEK